MSFCFDPTVDSYPNGSSVQLFIVFADTSNTAYDPTTVKLRLLSPAGIETDYTYAGATIAKTATGNYNAVVDPLTIAGTYNFRWEGIGPSPKISVLEGKFIIEDTIFAPD